MLAPMSVMQNHTSVQKQKEKDGTYDCIIKRGLNSPNIIFFDGEASDDLQYPESQKLAGFSDKNHTAE